VTRIKIFLTVGMLLAGGAVAIARPYTVSEARLGPSWHCSRTLVITTCQHKLRLQGLRPVQNP
jgi:hypothetical protein